MLQRDRGDMPLDEILASLDVTSKSALSWVSRGADHRVHIGSLVLTAPSFVGPDDETARSMVNRLAVVPSLQTVATVCALFQLDAPRLLTETDRKRMVSQAKSTASARKTRTHVCPETCRGGSACIAWHVPAEACDAFVRAGVCKMRACPFLHIFTVAVDVAFGDLQVAASRAHSHSFVEDVTPDGAPLPFKPHVVPEPPHIEGPAVTSVQLALAAYEKEEGFVEVGRGVRMRVSPALFAQSPPQVAGRIVAAAAADVRTSDERTERTMRNLAAQSEIQNRGLMRAVAATIIDPAASLAKASAMTPEEKAAFVEQALKKARPEGK
jgi:hypothetical protein